MSVSFGGSKGMSTKHVSVSGLPLMSPQKGLILSPPEPPGGAVLRLMLTPSGLSGGLFVSSPILAFEIGQIFIQKFQRPFDLVAYEIEEDVVQTHLGIAPSIGRACVMRVCVVRRYCRTTRDADH